MNGRRDTDDGLPGGAERPDAEATLALARRARDGDREALDELVARHQEWLLRIVRIELGGPASRARRYFDTMDIVQEAFGVVLRKIEVLDVRSAAGVRRWLSRIAAYPVQDSPKHHDAEKRNPDLEVPIDEVRGSGSPTANDPQLQAPTPSPEEQVWRKELEHLLDEAVARLPEHYQEIVLLRDYAKEGWEAIRERTGMDSVGAAKQIHHRAWIRIRSWAAPRLARVDRPPEA